MIAARDVAPRLQLLILRWSFCLATAAAVPASASTVQLRSAPPPRDVLLDSTRAMASALGAQSEFERMRLRYMPHGAGGGAGFCNETIGRFCYSYGDRSGISDPIPLEYEAVIRARGELIEKLDSLVSISEPGDWLTGQLVRYMLEAGEGDAALRRLQGCRAAEWWCEALRGMVHHSAARHELAERAFSDARELMHPYTLCQWDDITHLLSPADARAYAAMNCDERLSITRNAWWLGQPLWSVPGNHRRSEHDTRLIMQRLGRAGVNPTALRWGDDMEEIVVRFGWPDYWRRYWNTIGDPNPERPQVIQYTMEPSYHFLPRLSAMRSPRLATEEDWELLPKDSREEYSPDSLVFHKLAHQSARFLRRDSLLLFSRVSTADDEVLRWKKSLRVGQVFMRAPHESARTFFSETDSLRFSLTSLVANEDGLAGVELLSNDGRAARARFATPAIARNAHGNAISDFLVFSGDAGDAPTLESISRTTLTSLKFQRDSNVGVFWETYGLRAEDRVEVVLSVQPEDEAGFFSRLGQALRLVQRTGTLTVQWQESEKADREISARAVRMSLASLRPGNYSLRLSVRVNSGEPHEAVRRIEITERPRAGLEQLQPRAIP